MGNFEARLNKTTEKFERNRGKFERSAKTLVNVKAGIEHLMEKLSVVKLEDEPEIDIANLPAEAVLENFGNKLLKLLKMVKETHKKDYTEKAWTCDVERYEVKQLKKSQSDVRISHSPEEYDDDSAYEGLDGDIDEDFLDRKHVKYSSERIVAKQQSKRKKVKNMQVHLSS